MAGELVETRQCAQRVEIDVENCNLHGERVCHRDDRFGGPYEPKRPVTLRSRLGERCAIHSHLVAFGRHLSRVVCSGLECVWSWLLREAEAGLAAPSDAEAFDGKHPSGLGCRYGVLTQVDGD